MQKDSLIEQAAEVGFNLTRDAFDNGDNLALNLNEFIEAPQELTKLKALSVFKDSEGNIRFRTSAK